MSAKDKTPVYTWPQNPGEYMNYIFKAISTHNPLDTTQNCRKVHEKLIFMDKDSQVHEGYERTREITLRGEDDFMEGWHDFVDPRTGVKMTLTELNTMIQDDGSGNAQITGRLFQLFDAAFSLWMQKKTDEGELVAGTYYPGGPPVEE